MTRLFMTLLLTVFCSWVHAEGLYLKTINNTSLTTEQIQKSLKKLEEHKDIVLRGDLEVPPFHKRGKTSDSLAHSFCTTCHMSPPHTKSERTRTFMNMHTQYIACETCHFRPENVALTYQWQDTRNASLVRVKPELFRQAVQPEDKTKKTLPAKKEITQPAKGINPFYKIAPYYQDQAVALRNNEAFAQATKELWKKEGDLDNKAELRALIHAPLAEKGPECNACHNDKESLLNLAELGATAYQVEKIQNNIIAQFFARYKDKDQRIRIINLLR
ncbi:MAG: hypothetical protein K9L22_04495 [Methylococcaceae bacterium]|nr:hypothetical protein [Methylococcaceae bacterium]